jgi:hypothetical protein
VIAACNQPCTDALRFNLRSANHGRIGPADEQYRNPSGRSRCICVGCFR